MNQAILSLLVYNNFGVLNKVTGLFSRRGFNIKALSVGETEDPKYSRITIVTEGKERQLQQVYAQVLKLEDVRRATLLPGDNIVQRELALVKIKPGDGQMKAVGDIKDNFGVKTIEAPDGCIIIELTAPGSRIDTLIEQLRPLNIVELSRTGVTALILSGEALRETTVQ